jgi:hypothetical protein
MDVCVCWNHTRVARKRNLRQYPRWYGWTVFTQLMSFGFSFCPSLLLCAYVKRQNSKLMIWKKHFLFVKLYCWMQFERYPVTCFENICFVEVWLYVYAWIPWLRFFRAFSSVVRQMLGWCPQRRATARTLLNIFVALCIFCVVLCIFLCCSMWCLFCDVSCIVRVYMCTEQLPPGGYPIAVK